MGCDIHMYLEYTHPDAAGELYWECLISNAGSRDYAMFGILAGVRDDKFQLFEPVGVPEGRLSYQVVNAYYMRVAENLEQEEWEGWTSRANAESWENSGLTLIEQVPLQDGEFYERFVSPDNHSASWLSYEDFHKALGHYMNNVRPYGVEYAGILGAMRALHDRGCQTRVVFWFDN